MKYDCTYKKYFNTYFYQFLDHEDLPKLKPYNTTPEITEEMKKHIKFKDGLYTTKNRYIWDYHFRRNCDLTMLAAHLCKMLVEKDNVISELQNQITPKSTPKTRSKPKPKSKAESENDSKSESEPRKKKIKKLNKVDSSTT